MKTPEQYAADVPDCFIGREDDDRALFASLFAGAMNDARADEREVCARFVETSDQQKPLDVIAENMRDLLSDPKNRERVLAERT